MNDEPGIEARSSKRGATARHGALSFHDAMRLALAALLTIAVAVALWWVRNVILLLFAGALFGVLLYAASERIAGLTRLPRGLALASVLVLVVASLSLIVWQAGPILAEQFDELLDSIAQTAERVLETLAGPAVLGNLAWEDVASLMPSPWGIASGATAVLTGALGVVTAIALVLIFALFFSATPHVYTGLVVRAAPPERRAETRAMLSEAGHILRWWLKGQLAAMIAIGALTYAGLVFLGMPFAIPLALFAGLTNFIPYIGPFVSGVAILLVAVGEGTTMVIWAVGLYVVIQSFESGLLVPLIQARAVRLPPVLVITSQLVFGAVFGVLGVMLATPIAAAATVPLRRVFDQEPD